MALRWILSPTKTIWQVFALHSTAVFFLISTRLIWALLQRTQLSQFATSLQNNPETDITILGFTDNVGTRAANEKVSTQRANNVQTYLNQRGVSSTRMNSKGMAWDYPVASNDTEAGRAQNRRVEIYITANENMVKQANDGTLK